MTDQASTDQDLQRFRAAWRGHESMGRCDGIDGCEYKRVLSEWYEAGKPEPLLFIPPAANMGPRAH